MGETTEPSVRRFNVLSTDPEYAHQVLRESYLDFSVRYSGSPDAFAFTHQGIAAPDFMVARMRYSMRAEFCGERTTSLVVPTGRDGYMAAGARHEHRSPELGTPVLLPLQRPDWWFRMDGVTNDVVTLQRAAVDRQAATLGFPPGVLRFSAMTPTPGLGVQHWRNVVAHVTRNVLPYDEIVRSELALATATRMLATAVLVTFPNTGMFSLHRLPGEGRALPAVMRRAEAYIDAHAADDIGIDDIARAARISVRGLQRAFRRHRNTSPLAHLRRARLDGAHQDLRAADPAGDETVASIAARWGFTHPGRFAVRYRQAYGRSPSATLLD